MNRTLALSLITCSLLAGSFLTPASTAEMDAAARDAYLKAFDRIGLNTTPGDAMMLRILVEAAGLKRGIEVGTATGYGALHMGVAFERTGGHLYTVDIDPDMVKAARGHIRKMGLEDTVTVIEGDALKVLPTLKGEYDFMFIDALKQDYLKYFKAVEARLTPGAVIVADNVIRSEKAMRDFLDYMEQSSNYEGVTIRASMEKGDGMTIYYKLAK